MFIPKTCQRRLGLSGVLRPERLSEDTCWYSTPCVFHKGQPGSSITDPVPFDSAKLGICTNVVEILIHAVV